MARGGGREGAETPAESEWPRISVSEHPRARGSVARMKAWGGLLGFAIVALTSWRAGVEPFEVGLRALGAGVATYLIAWLAGVALWQRIVVAEAKAVAQRRRDRREAELRGELDGGDGQAVA